MELIPREEYAYIEEHVLVKCRLIENIRSVYNIHNQTIGKLFCSNNGDILVVNFINEVENDENYSLNR